MNNNNPNPQNYKKSFFQRIADFIDKITGGAKEMTLEESKYMDEHFNDLPVWKKKSRR